MENIELPDEEAQLHLVASPGNLYLVAFRLRTDLQSG
jgi:hypothetical protein